MRRWSRVPRFSESVFSRKSVFCGREIEKPKNAFVYLLGERKAVSGPTSGESNAGEEDWPQTLKSTTKENKTTKATHRNMIRMLESLEMADARCKIDNISSNPERLNLQLRLVLPGHRIFAAVSFGDRHARIIVFIF